MPKNLGPNAATTDGISQVEFTWAVPSLDAAEGTFAPIEKINGTYVDKYVCAFDDTIEEYRNGMFMVPQRIYRANAVVFTAWVIAKTAVPSKNIKLRFGHSVHSASGASDSAYTNVDSSDTAVDTTQGDFTLVTWESTPSSLGWYAGQQVYFRISRTAPGSNNLAGDLYWELFSIRFEIR